MTSPLCISYWLYFSSGVVLWFFCHSCFMPISITTLAAPPPLKKMTSDTLNSDMSHNGWYVYMYIYIYIEICAVCGVHLTAFAKVHFVQISLFDMFWSECWMWCSLHDYALLLICVKRKLEIHEICDFLSCQYHSFVLFLIIKRNSSKVGLQVKLILQIFFGFLNFFFFTLVQLEMVEANAIDRLDHVLTSKASRRLLLFPRRWLGSRYHCLVRWSVLLWDEKKKILLWVGSVVLSKYRSFQHPLVKPIPMEACYSRSIYYVWRYSIFVIVTRNVKTEMK